MAEDNLSGKEYRDVLKLVGLSYDDQIWAYGLSLYRFSQTRDVSNLTMDERVLRRLIAIGLYDNDAFQNSLPSRRAMMHSVAMAERLWEMSRAERDRVRVIGLALPVLANRPLGRPLGAGTEGGQGCLRSPPGTSRRPGYQPIGVDQHAVQRAELPYRQSHVGVPSELGGTSYSLECRFGRLRTQDQGFGGEGLQVCGYQALGSWEWNSA